MTETNWNLNFVQIPVSELPDSEVRGQSEIRLTRTWTSFLSSFRR